MPLIQFDVATRNAMLDAVEASIGASPTLRIRTGAAPANTLAARTGTVLATIVLPANWMQDAAGASKQQAGTWADNAADASGTAMYFDITDSGGVVRWQGDCSASGGGAFMILNNVVFAAGQPFSIDTFVLNANNG